jgi:hypothetical protein
MFDDLTFDKAYVADFFRFVADAVERDEIVLVGYGFDSKPAHRANLSLSVASEKDLAEAFFRLWGHKK